MIEKLASTNPSEAGYHLEIGPHYQIRTHKSWEFGVTTSGAHDSVDSTLGLKTLLIFLRKTQSRSLLVTEGSGPRARLSLMAMSVSFPLARDV